MKINLTGVHVPLKFLEAGWVSANWGPTIRGGFGKELRAVCCDDSRRECRECSDVRNCAYACLFESPVLPDSTLMKRYTNYPHPIVFDNPAGIDGPVSAGDVAEIGVILVGGAAVHMPLVIQAFRRLGRAGLGRGRVRFVVDDRLPDVSVGVCGSVSADEHYDSQHALGADHLPTSVPGAVSGHAGSVSSGQPEPVRNVNETPGRSMHSNHTGSAGRSESIRNANETPERMTTPHHAASPGWPEPFRHVCEIVPGPAYDAEFVLEFLSPVRIQKGEKLARELVPADLVENLARRAFLMGSIYCGVSDPVSGAFRDAAARLKVVEYNMQWSDAVRFSTRQQREVPLGGLVGNIRLRGDIGCLGPLFRIGEFIHVGKNATFGLGRFRLLRL